MVASDGRLGIAVATSWLRPLRQAGQIMQKVGKNDPSSGLVLWNSMEFQTLFSEIQ